MSDRPRRVRQAGRPNRDSTTRSDRSILARCGVRSGPADPSPPRRGRHGSLPAGAKATGRFQAPGDTASALTLRRITIVMPITAAATSNQPHSTLPAKITPMTRMAPTSLTMAYARRNSFNAGRTLLPHHRDDSDCESNVGRHEFPRHESRNASRSTQRTRERRNRRIGRHRTTSTYLPTTG